MMNWKRCSNFVSVLVTMMEGRITCPTTSHSMQLPPHGMVKTHGFKVQTLTFDTRSEKAEAWEAWHINNSLPSSASLPFVQGVTCGWPCGDHPQVIDIKHPSIKLSSSNDKWFSCWNISETIEMTSNVSRSPNGGAHMIHWLGPCWLMMWEMGKERKKDNCLIFADGD